MSCGHPRVNHRQLLGGPVGGGDILRGDAETIDASSSSRVSAAGGSGRMRRIVARFSSVINVLRVERVEGDLDGPGLTVGRVGDGDGVPGCVRADGGDQSVTGADDAVVDLGDQRTGRDARLRRRATGLHLRDEGARRRGVLARRLHREPEPCLGRLAGALQFLRDADRLIDRDGEAQSDAAALLARAVRQARDGGVDADERAVAVDQRATGVAGLMAASVWMASITDAVLSFSPCVDTGRFSELMMPVVTVPARPRGEPTAITFCPTARLPDVPTVIGVSPVLSALMTAMSRSGRRRRPRPPTCCRRCS